MCSLSMIKVCIHHKPSTRTEANTVTRPDGDGKITTAELAQVVHAVDPQSMPEQVTRMIEAVDINGNGTIDFLEFLSMMSTIRSIESGQDFIEKFKAFDKNGDGLVSISELKYVMAKLGAFSFIENFETMVDLNVLIGERLSDEQAAEIVCMADIDGDSCINYYGWDKNPLPCEPSLMIFDLGDSEMDINSSSRFSSLDLPALLLYLHG